VLTAGNALQQLCSVLLLVDPCLLWLLLLLLLLYLLRLQFKGSMPLLSGC